jgi:hypothetical protein
MIILEGGDVVVIGGSCHCHAPALYFMWYNFARLHKSIRITPAMAAGLTSTL